MIIKNGFILCPECKGNGYKGGIVKLRGTDCPTCEAVGQIIDKNKMKMETEEISIQQITIIELRIILQQLIFKYPEMETEFLLTIAAQVQKTLAIETNLNNINQTLKKIWTDTR